MKACSSSVLARSAGGTALASGSSRAASPRLRVISDRPSPTASSTHQPHLLACRLQASSAASSSFVARANNDEEEDEDAELLSSEENSKSLSSASAAMATAARSSSATATRSASAKDDAVAESKKLLPLASLAHAVGVLHRFSRPHTMLGTTISILSVSALALVRSWIFVSCSRKRGEKKVVQVANEEEFRKKKKKDR